MKNKIVHEGTQGLDLTSEQKAILETDADIRINAVAGSGKTTTLIHYAATRAKNARILYLAFNRSVRIEASKKFNEKALFNVQVETAHSLAFKHIVPNSAYKVRQGSYRTYEIARWLELKSMSEKHGEYVLANHIGKFMTYFCNSQASKVQELNYLDIVQDPKAKSFVKHFYRQIEHGTRLLLSKMHKGEIEITHDFYLKLFQLSKPLLNFDYILFDEGQDASPAMLDIFLNQKAVKLIVGDTHQQIYAWRHAVNSLEKVDFPDHNLSTSFRFHQHIATLAVEILNWKNHLQKLKPVTIRGKGRPPQTKFKATIARTNLGLLLKAINYITDNSRANHLYFEGNLNSYTYAEDGASLYDVLNLFNNRRGDIKDQLVGSMKNLVELEDYIEKTEDAQLGMMVEIVKEYENEIPSLIRSLKSKHVDDEEKEKAEMIFSTVHRAKGMEYDVVYLADDFITESSLKKSIEDKSPDEPLNVVKLNEEINLLYVAATRCKGMLHIPEQLVPLHLKPSPHIQVIPKQKQPGIARTEKNNSFVEKRRIHKNAYERWSPEADDELRRMFHKGLPISDMAFNFGRNKGAILSRLKKIGCLKERE